MGAYETPELDARDINGKKDELERLDTVVLAVSSNQPADNAKALETIKAPVARSGVEPFGDMG